MGDLAISLAQPSDDGELRKIIRENPMDGHIRVAFGREPDFFIAKDLGYDFAQTIVSRDGRTGEIAGFGTRAIRRMYVNGAPGNVGYLSGLRLRPAYRHGRSLSLGYRFLRELHGDGLADYYLTTIGAENKEAIDLLTRGRKGLPSYMPVGLYRTFAVDLRRRVKRPAASAIRIERGTPDRIDAIVDCLQRNGMEKQFYPVYRNSDFGGSPRDAGLPGEGGPGGGLTPGELPGGSRAEGRAGGGVNEASIARSDPAGGGRPVRNLAAEDFYLAFDGGKISGVAAAWDQRSFKQTRVAGYAGAVRLARPFYNAGAKLFGYSPLPSPGSEIPFFYIACVAVDGNDPEIFAAILQRIHGDADKKEYSHFLAGLHSGDRLTSALERFHHIEYRTLVYLVYWEDDPDRGGHAIRPEDAGGRPPYLELGTL